MKQEFFEIGSILSLKRRTSFWPFDDGWPNHGNHNHCVWLDANTIIMFVKLAKRRSPKKEYIPEGYEPVFLFKNKLWVGNILTCAKPFEFFEKIEQ